MENEDTQEIKAEDVGDAEDVVGRETLSGKPAAEGLEKAPAPQPIDPQTGMHKDYWVLPEEERAKQRVRPLRHEYTHKACSEETRMGRKIAETFAVNPKFYSSTFCSNCNCHFHVKEFLWKGTEEEVGS